MRRDIANYSPVENACKLCSPLGASFVFKGIKNAMNIMHGSQGCSTYIRRYMISHFKEPIDIASSNFSEDTTVFGGSSNLKTALANIINQYNPSVVGISTTCLSETIGEDSKGIVKEFKAENKDKNLPVIINVSTPSYTGTHIEGFHKTVKATVKTLARNKEHTENILNILPGMLSPADIRHLKDILTDFGIKAVILPDYSDTLDGGPWNEYHKIPKGGTDIHDIKTMGSAKYTLECGDTLKHNHNLTDYFKEKFSQKTFNIGMPIGIEESENLFDILSEISNKPVPLKYTAQKMRLLDAYADAHKYLSGKKAIIYGDEDLVTGITRFLTETGIKPVLAASGGDSGYLNYNIKKITNDEKIKVMADVDFARIEEAAKDLNADFMIGNSKGYKIARKLNIPLIRIGFPVHDRIGGSRIKHIGYSGTTELFDKIVNTLLEKRQTDSNVGYSYL